MTVATTFINDDFKELFIPYRGISDVARDDSPIPRGELRYYGAALSLTDGDVTGQFFNIKLTLPRNFAYALAELSLTTIGSTNEFRTRGYGSINNGVSAARDLNYYWSIESPGNVATGTGAELKVFTSGLGAPRVIARAAAPGEDITLICTVRNDGVNPTGMSVGASNFWLLQFDIEQVTHYAFNTPILVR